MTRNFQNGYAILRWDGLDPSLRWDDETH
jgi:hypothetical protein